MILLCMCGMMFLLKESLIFANVRSLIVRQHHLLYELFECAACLGFHCGWVSYLLTMHSFDAREMIVYAFAGMAICMLYQMTLERLGR